jgi:SSS family solute:Na+ symporter
MTDVYDVSTGGAYAVLYSVLGIFTILAILSAGYGSSCLPSNVRDVIVAKNNEGSEEAKETENEITVSGGAGGLLATDFFLSARNSTGTFGIAMSFFASGMGAWVVYGTTEMGATPQLSWLGVFGYSIASAIPGVFVMWLGPLIKEATKGEKAFSTTDFCHVRYGRLMQLSCAAISVFYMWIYLVAEFTSISNVYALLVGKESYGELNKNYTTSIAVSIGVIVLFYTGLAGLPASIVTDKFQGLMMMGLVFLLTITVCAVPENRISSEQFALASNWTADGFYALIILIIAIISAELFNQATWQRVWAAKDTPSLRKGFGIGSLLIFFLMMVRIETTNAKYYICLHVYIYIHIYLSTSLSL